MASIDSVGQNTQISFGNFNMARATGVNLGANANAVAVMPLFSGGMGGTGSYIIRRIVVANPYNTAGGAVPNGATANITIGFTNDGANLVTGTVTLTNLTAANTYVDLTPGSGLNSNVASIAFNNNALFVNVTNNIANLGCLVSVYGELVTF